MTKQYTKKPCKKCGCYQVIANGIGCHDQHIPHVCMEEIMKGNLQCEITTCLGCEAIRVIHAGQWRIEEKETRQK